MLQRSTLQTAITGQFAVSVDMWLWPLQTDKVFARVCACRRPRIRTLGNSLIWLASSNNSSNVRVYRITSSGTAVKLQWRRSMYSTWRLQAFHKGKHLNIVPSIQSTYASSLNSPNQCASFVRSKASVLIWGKNLGHENILHEILKQYSVDVTAFLHSGTCCTMPPVGMSANNSKQEWFSKI